MEEEDPEVATETSEFIEIGKGLAMVRNDSNGKSSLLSSGSGLVS